MILRIAAALLGATVFLAQTGCASPPPVLPPPKPPTESLRSRFGRIEIVANHDPTPFKVTGPAMGSGDGAGRGALLGAGISLAIIQGSAQASQGGRELGALFFIAGVAVAIAILPVAVLVGAIYGMSAAPSAEQVQEAADRLTRAVEEAGFSASVAKSFARDARQQTDEDFPAEGPYDTSIEFGAPQILLSGPYAINPKLKLSVVVPVQIVQGGKPQYRTLLAWHGTTEAEFFEWAERDAGRFREALTPVPDILVAPAVHRMLLLHELPTNREWTVSK